MRNLFVYRIAVIFLFLFSGIPPTYADLELEMPDKTISMDLQNANLKDVLKVFSIQSGLNFIASQNVEDRKITLFLDKVPIQEGMNKLFEANNLTYEYDEAANICVVKYWGEPQVDVLTKIYRLKNRSVASSRIETEKTALMSASATGTGGTAASGSAASAAASSSTEEGTIMATIKQVLSKEGKISEDRRTNSLIVTDIPSRFLVIDDLIAHLDVSQPMVMLEVEILDVSKSCLDKLGPDIGSMDLPNPLDINFTKGFTFNGITGALKTQTAAATTYRGGLTFGRAQNFDYALLLDFVRQQQDTKFLARPKILTLNNETAEIGVVKDEVVNLKTVTTTSEGGTDQTTTEYERATSLTLTPEGIGVFLRVTPQVNLETNEITMVVNPKTSSAQQDSLVPTTDRSGNAQVAKDPEVRTTKSIVKVKDGETIVLGGLIHKEKQTTVRKLPILGDIPILGALFRHHSTDVDVDRELLVFITPRIVRESKDRLAKADTAPNYALQYLSSGTKRKQEINNLLDVYDEK
jgi:type II secretory pathway component GspD/PulD (secretin)